MWDAPSTAKNPSTVFLPVSGNLNFDRAMQTGAGDVIVVEGFFDALKVHQAGHPAVVALMGASFSQRQSELLLSRFARVTLMLDGDETGRRASEVIAQLLKPKVPVHTVALPNGVQPDQLSSAEINTFVDPASRTS
jgi:DNA primase